MLFFHFLIVINFFAIFMAVFIIFSIQFYPDFGHEPILIDFFSKQGTATDKITFTAQEDSGYSGIITNDPKKFGARLVDGPSPLAGRLQLLYENKWRSVCTNSRKYVDFFRISK